MSWVALLTANKLNTWTRIAPFIGLSKRRILMNVFLDSLFSYWPFIWMCHSHKNRKINRLHERCLNFIYNDKQSTFLELLEVGGSVYVHMRNIQYLAIEMFRFSRDLSPFIMNDIFTKNDNSRFNLRQMFDFSGALVESLHHGREVVSFQGPKIWNMLPDDCKDIDNVNIFKNKIKKCKPENCLCRLCKVYIKNISFV